MENQTEELHPLLINGEIRTIFDQIDLIERDSELVLIENGKQIDLKDLFSPQIEIRSSHKGENTKTGIFVSTNRGSYNIYKDIYYTGIIITKICEIPSKKIYSRGDYQYVLNDDGKLRVYRFQTIIHITKMEIVSIEFGPDDYNYVDIDGVLHTKCPYFSDMYTKQSVTDNVSIKDKVSGIRCGNVGEILYLNLHYPLSDLILNSDVRK